MELKEVVMKFYRESSHRWYADIPSWEGDKSALEMVDGADVMLDIMSQGESCVNLFLSREFVEDATELKFERLSPECGEGAYYKMNSYKGIEYNLQVWLCDVTKFVFGDFPPVIYIVN